MPQSKLQKKILGDSNFRKQLARSNLYWFFHIYFPHYVKFPTADFQKEIYEALQDWDKKFIEVLAFRASAKSTIAMLTLPIWAVITGKAKFILLLADTFSQAKLHLNNIKSELESNYLLIKDFGPFEAGGEWTTANVTLPKYDARIISQSTGQRIRGLRHKEFRPQLLVADDLENLEGIRTKEGRDKVFEWFTGDVFPALDLNAKVVLIGNLLHSDCLMMKIKKQVKEGKRKGQLLEFPLYDEKEKIIWPGKFPDKESIEKEKAKVGDLRSWQREYLLKIIPAEGQEVEDSWIKYYDRIPEQAVILKGTGVDLAISKKETADYTSLVSGKLTKIESTPKIYIVSHPVNQRLSLHETIEKAKSVSLALGNGSLTPLFVESTAYQAAALGEMQRVGLPAKGIQVSVDKRARLRTVATYIQNGTVLFPKTGCEDLIIQLTHFGVEAHDDLCDAFVLLVQALMNQAVRPEPKLTVFGGDGEEKEESGPKKIRIGGRSKNGVILDWDDIPDGGDRDLTRPLSEEARRLDRLNRLNR